MGTLFVNILSIEYVGILKPLISRFENRLYLFNDFLIHILVLLTFIFTDYVDDIEN